MNLHEESVPVHRLLMAMKANPNIESICVRHGFLCGVAPFGYTWGILFGINEIGYERRYCYESHHEAVAALRDWNGNEGTHPDGKWVKLKGTFMGEPVDMLNPQLE